MPPAGSNGAPLGLFSKTLNSIIIIRPNQKVGMDIPRKLKTVTT